MGLLECYMLILILNFDSLKWFYYTGYQELPLKGLKWITEELRGCVLHFNLFHINFSSIASTSYSSFYYYYSNVCDFYVLLM